jgi:hypothetical protein
VAFGSGSVFTCPGCSSSVGRVGCTLHSSSLGNMCKLVTGPTCKLHTYTLSPSLNVYSLTHSLSHS